MASWQVACVAAAVAAGVAAHGADGSEEDADAGTDPYVVKAGYGVLNPEGQRSYMLDVETAKRECYKVPACHGVAHHGEPATDDEIKIVFFINKNGPQKVAGWTTYLLPDRGEALTQCAMEDGEEAAAAVEKDATYIESDDTNPLDEFDDPPVEATPPSAESEELYQLGLAELYAEGESGLRNVTKAFECFNRSAAEGHPGAQFMLGFMYTTGLGVAPSEMLSILHYTFAAMGNSSEAALALAHRYNFGYGVPRSCQDARRYFSMTADRVARAYRQMQAMPQQRQLRLSDPAAYRQRQKEEEILHYYQYNAEKGTGSAQLTLGYAFLWGIRGMEKDGASAKRYFEHAAEKGEVSAYGALGTMYAQGVTSALSSIERDYTLSREYFEKGAEQDHPVALNGLGYLTMKGVGGIRRNYTRAFGLFKRAAAKHNPEALYNLGVLYQEGKGVRRDAALAEAHLVQAAEMGLALARWRLGRMASANKPCQYAVGQLKTVSARGEWAQLLDEAHTNYLDGDYSSALVRYMVASELGYEVAHSNAAFMLDKGVGLEELEFEINPTYVEQGLSAETREQEDFVRHSLALKYFKKAAEQNDVTAPVKVGDYHYYGLGTERDVLKALTAYKLAVTRGSDQAMFNLGYMHEHGVSIPQSFTLAKRYYDRAYETSEHAYWAITLALLKLQAHEMYQSAVEWMESGASLASILQAAKGTDSSAFKVWGHHIEDLILATLLLLLFLTLFVLHTARQVQVRPVQEENPPAADEQEANDDDDDDDDDDDGDDDDDDDGAEEGAGGNNTDSNNNAGDTGDTTGDAAPQAPGNAPAQ